MRAATHDGGRHAACGHSFQFWEILGLLVVMGQIRCNHSLEHDSRLSSRSEGLAQGCSKMGAYSVELQLENGVRSAERPVSTASTPASENTRGCATLLSKNSLTSGYAPIFHVHISMVADAALTRPAESSTSSVQHARQSLTRFTSLTTSSSLPG